MDRPGSYRVGCRKYPYKLRCRVCGVTFQAKRCTAMLCSPRCRKARERIREKAAHAELVAKMGK